MRACTALGVLLLSGRAVRMLEALAQILTGRPFVACGAPPPRPLEVKVNGVAKAPDADTLALALDVLGTFDFSGASFPPTSPLPAASHLRSPLARPSPPLYPCLDISPLLVSCPRPPLTPAPLALYAAFILSLPRRAASIPRSFLGADDAPQSTR